MIAMTRGAVAVALITLSSAAGAAYKCKDADGKISYSEQPCQGTATQTKLKTDADAREEFLRQLQELAKTQVLWDAPTIEKTLRVKLAEVSTAQFGFNTYSFATMPAGAPILGSRVMLPAGENSYNGGAMELRFDPKRCVSPEMIRQIFGLGADLNPEQSFNYVVNAGGGYRTEISGGYSSEMTFVQGGGYRQSPRCANYMSMRQAAPQQSRGSGSSTRRR